MKERITKTEYYNLGGQANSALFRKTDKRGYWQYYMRDIEEAYNNAARLKKELTQ